MTGSLITRSMYGNAGGFLAGVFSAIIFVIAFAHPGMVFVILSCLSALALFLVGLGAGVTSCVFASAVALGGLWLAKSLSFALFYVVLLAFPAIGISFLAMRHKDGADGQTAWFSEGNLLTITAFYPCFIFLAGVIGMIGHPGGLLGFTNEMLALGASGFSSVIDPRQMVDFLNMLAHSLPLIIGGAWILFMLIMLYLAQAALKQFGWNLRPDFNIQNIILPKWLIAVAAAMGLVAARAPSAYAYVGLNLSIMLALPFIFAGISVVHAWAARSVFRVWILLAYYILLSIPWTWTIVPMFSFTLLLGVTDQWVNFRRRFAVQPKQRRSI